MSMNTNVLLPEVTVKNPTKSFATPAQATLSAINPPSGYGGITEVDYSIMRINKTNRDKNIETLYKVNQVGGSLAGGGNYIVPTYDRGNAMNPIPFGGYLTYRQAYGVNSNKCIPEKQL